MCICKYITTVHSQTHIYKYINIEISTHLEYTLCEFSWKSTIRGPEDSMTSWQVDTLDNLSSLVSKLLMLGSKYQTMKVNLA